MGLGLVNPNTIKRDADAIARAKQVKASATISDFSVIREKLKNHIQEYNTITSGEELKAYIDRVIAFGMCAIDTETTGLDPITDKIVGFSMFYPGEKAVYIPINHISNITFLPIESNLDSQICTKELERAEQSGVKWIYHNFVFDRRVIRWQLGVILSGYWDTQKAWRYLNENESSKLKVLNQKYLDSEDDEALTFESLFEGITFDKVPIDVATLYAAGDPKKTWNLFEYENSIFDRNENLSHLRDIFMKVEMPIQVVLADMIDKGVYFDKGECSRLSEKWEQEIKEKQNILNTIVEKDSGRILSFIQQHPTTAIKYPLNTSSPKQVSIYLYDILGCSPGKNNSKGTGEAELKRIDNEFCRALLDLRGLEKIYSTYLVALPRAVSEKTGRVHAGYNSYGAATGRMSSSDPNMQNIPSHHKEIRNIFRAPEGKVLISADYSQQEPRLLASCSGDEKMLEAYRTGRDIYSWIASVVYKRPYEECLEHYPDGSTNKEGKELRSSMKSVILGIMYGRSAPGIAEQLNISVQDANCIIQDFYDAFPTVKSWNDSTIENGKKTGFVQTVWGRKRRLPDLKLPEFELYPMEGYTQVADVLDFDSITEATGDGISDVDYNYFMRKLLRCRSYKQKQEVEEEAKAKQIRVIDNGGKIADAQRQAINSIIQGSAADMTKWAMIKIYKNKDLQSLGAELIIQVHDEVILECPKENAKEASKILQKCMLDAAADMINVPMKCDTVITERWGDM